MIETRVVPAEPTVVQVNAGVDADDLRTGFETVKHIYRSMVDAAPPTEAINVDRGTAVNLASAEESQAAACFNYLQNIPVKDAEAFFWNYSGRTERRKAIQKAITKEMK